MSVAAQGVREKASANAQEACKAAERHLADARNTFIGLVLGTLFLIVSILVAAIITPFSQSSSQKVILITGAAIAIGYAFYAHLQSKAIVKTAECVLWQIRAESPNKAISVEDLIQTVAAKMDRKPNNVRNVLLSSLSEIPLQVRIMDPGEGDTRR